MENSWRRELLNQVFLFSLPFLFLFPYVLSIHDRYMVLGNDFNMLYFSYKAYLLDFLSNGQFPFWSPTEACGYPFFSSPFTQAFYPLNVFLALFYRVAGGYTGIDHQRFTVLGISIFALGLYRWLKEAGASTRGAFMAAAIFPLSFQITEILRFPNAIHTMAWYPWILWTLTRKMRETPPRLLNMNSFYLWIFTVCLLTGGYPYYVYYSAFLFVPYILYFLIQEKMLPTGSLPAFFSELVSRTAHLWFVFLGAGLTCFPYLSHISFLMNQTADRSGGNLTYSLQASFSLKQTIGALIFPPLANFEGWYFFGVAPLLVIILYWAGWPGDNGEENSRWQRLIPLLWIATISYITYGNDSWLFLFFWNWLPFFSRLRCWARMNIILVPLFAMVFARAFEAYLKCIQGPDRARAKKIVLGFLVVYALILIGQGYCLLEEKSESYWENYVVGRDFFKPVSTFLPGVISRFPEFGKRLKEKTFLDHLLRSGFLICGGISFLAFLGNSYLLYSFSLRRKFVAEKIALFSFLTFCLLELGYLGPWIWVGGPQKVTPRSPYQIRENLDASWKTPRFETYNSISLTPEFSVGIMQNWYFQRYISFRDRFFEKSETRKFLGLEDGKKVFFLPGTIEENSVSSFLDKTLKSSEWFSIRKYDGDHLILDIDVPAGGYVCFIDNWDPFWKGKIDDHEEPVEKLFGTFKALRVGPGKHLVEFAYRPPLLPGLTNKP